MSSFPLHEADPLYVHRFFQGKGRARRNIFGPAGTSLASTPVDGTHAPSDLFETEVHPLQIVSLAAGQKHGEPER